MDYNEQLSNMTLQQLSFMYKQELRKNYGSEFYRSSIQTAPETLDQRQLDDSMLENAGESCVQSDLKSIKQDNQFNSTFLGSNHEVSRIDSSCDQTRPSVSQQRGNDFEDTVTTVVTYNEVDFQKPWIEPAGYGFSKGKADWKPITNGKRASTNASSPASMQLRQMTAPTITKQRPLPSNPVTAKRDLSPIKLKLNSKNIGIPDKITI